MKSMNVLGAGLLAVVFTLAACSGGGGGTGTGDGTADSGKPGTSPTGSGSSSKPGPGPSPSSSSTSSSSSSASCCLQLKFYSCASDDDATKCFNTGSPGACKADPSQNDKCCKEAGSSCSKGSDCCSGSCVTDPDDEDNTVCK